MTIQKQILLHAPRERVWQALADSTQFGAWFGMRFDGPFAPGALMRCAIVPTTVDREVAEAQKPYEGVAFEITIERMEPERMFSYRWHPGAVEPEIDYSVEPTTLVAFELEGVADGVLLTITETGFEALPARRREKAFAQNEQGWAMVPKLIEKYLAPERD